MPFCVCRARARKRNGVWTCWKTPACWCSPASSTISNPKRSWCSVCSPSQKPSTKGCGGCCSACKPRHGSCSQAGSVLGLLFLAKYVDRVLACIHCHIEPADHHFFPRLVAPADLLLRVRIVAVVGRIVEVRGALDLRPLGQHDRIGEVIEELPVEIVIGNAQHGL